MAGEDITVSRDLLRAELGQMELRLVDRLSSELEKKATVHSVEAVAAQLGRVEAEHGARLTTLEQQTARSVGVSDHVWKVIAVVMPLITAIVAAYLGYRLSR